MNDHNTKQRETYKSDAESTSFTILSLLQSIGIDLSYLLMIDHICYRCISEDQYKNMKQKLSEQSELLDESLIGGRAVSIWKLNSPFEVSGRQIPCIELSAPKSDNTHPEGWEHIEIVVDDLEGFYTSYSSLITETKGFTKTRNRDLEIEFPDSRPGGQLAVKFHEQSIEDILLEEKNSRFNS